ncbi:uncharacterized protein LOC124993765 [Sciurus carolinensis]|uniref:uncharacterized protein LOC124993765 n=1 Tax=Sciurus carolinensis TaxID=30640 RepID=UPI001FB35BD7|nr:uncharacterized protein LOC124993765 [Sciurus carolinensis]
MSVVICEQEIQEIPKPRSYQRGVMDGGHVLIVDWSLHTSITWRCLAAPGSAWRVAVPVVSALSRPRCADWDPGSAWSPRDSVWVTTAPSLLCGAGAEVQGQKARPPQREVPVVRGTRRSASPSVLQGRPGPGSGCLGSIRLAVIPGDLFFLLQVIPGDLFAVVHPVTCPFVHTKRGCRHERQRGRNLSNALETLRACEERQQRLFLGPRRQLQILLVETSFIRFPNSECSVTEQDLELSYKHLQRCVVRVEEQTLDVRQIRVLSQLCHG